MVPSAMSPESHSLYQPEQHTAQRKVEIKVSERAALSSLLLLLLRTQLTVWKSCRQMRNVAFEGSEALLSHIPRYA